jgi:hypothetical protein
MKAQKIVVARMRAMRRFLLLLRDFAGPQPG